MGKLSPVFLISNLDGLVHPPLGDKCEVLVVLIQSLDAPDLLVTRGLLAVSCTLSSWPFHGPGAERQLKSWVASHLVPKSYCSSDVYNTSMSDGILLASLGPYLSLQLRMKQLVGSDMEKVYLEKKVRPFCLPSLHFPTALYRILHHFK